MPSLSVFVLSLLISGLALLIERKVGIGWDFHPDVVTYITENSSVIESGWMALPNQLYYFIANWVGGDVSILISLNIIAYSLTNVLITKAYLNYSFSNTAINRGAIFKLMVLGWLLFTPYRLHLAIHGLKDSFIILSLCTFSYYHGRTAYSWLAWIPLLLLRVYASFYALLFVRGRFIVLGMLVVLIGITFFDFSMLEFLQERNETDMRAREFDTIPPFSELGLLGTFLRMIIWPLLIVSGAFAVISPALLFIPVAIEVVLSRIWSRYVLGNWGLTVGIVLCMMIIAAFVNSFTAYIRYVYPVLIIAPVIMMRRKMD